MHFFDRLLVIQLPPPRRGTPRYDGRFDGFDGLDGLDGLDGTGDAGWSVCGGVDGDGTLLVALANAPAQATSRLHRALQTSSVNDACHWFGRFVVEYDVPPSPAHWASAAPVLLITNIEHVPASYSATQSAWSGSLSRL